MPANYFCHFTEQFDHEKTYKMGIQRYYIRSSDETIDIRIK